MNIQGILSVEFYEASNVTLPFLQKNASINFSSFTAEASQKFNFIPGTCAMKSNKKTNKAGNLDNISVSFAIAGNEPDTNAELDFQNNIPHIYVVTDNTGLKYVLGHNKGPSTKLTYNFKNDADGKGGRSISVKISLLTHIFPVYTQ
ncbi:MAG: hypothetical protein QM503_10665 [Bacteroidota bacterium]